MSPRFILHHRTFPDRVEIVKKDISLDDSIFLSDFCYPYTAHENFNTKHVGNPDAPIFSTVVQGLENQHDIKLTHEQLLAVKYWVTHLFNWRLKEKTDNWIIDYWIDQIKKTSVQHIELSRDNFAKPIYDFRNANTVFHTDEKTQQWLAEILYKKIKG